MPPTPIEFYLRQALQGEKLKLSVSVQFKNRRAFNANSFSFLFPVLKFSDALDLAIAIIIRSFSVSTTQWYYTVIVLDMRTPKIRQS